jgi:DNA polymerase-3 subunit delta
MNGKLRFALYLLIDSRLVSKSAIKLPIIPPGSPGPISKDYNNFELRSALVEKDVLKANKIIKYFEENPKNNPLQMTLAILFNFFSNLMLAYYAPEKSDQGIAAQLGLKSPWQAKEYMAAMRRYSGVKVMQIIHAIRECDARSKGIGNPSTPDGELLRDLIYFILH